MCDSHPSSFTCHNTAQRAVPPGWRLATAAQLWFSYLTCKLMPQPDWLTLFSKRRCNAFWGCRLNIGWHTNYLFFKHNWPLFELKNIIFSVKQEQEVEQLRYKDKTARQVRRFWEEDKMDRLLLKFLIQSKGRPGLFLLESCSSGLFGYSFNEQQSLNAPYSSISCPPGSRWQQRLDLMEVQADGKPCRV